MSGVMTAAWWREYRVRRATELRAYNRRRRSEPKVRAQRHASEQRRRSRIRAAELANVVQLRHPLLDAAAALVPIRAPGRLLRFRPEMTAEDARSEAVVALIEGRDPVAAVAAFRARERAWAAIHGPFIEGAA